MKTTLTIMIATVLLLGAVPGQAQQGRSMDDLLRLIQQRGSVDEREVNEREQRFRGARGEQQNLLTQARNRRAAEERRSENLENNYEENEIRIADLTQQLNTRLGSLKELFGVLQQVAGDTQGQFSNSLTNIQWPDRNVFLDDLAQKMGSSSQLASIEEIEHLWFELQREMTESGRVVKYPTRVITKDGNEETLEVVRVGVFNIVTDGKYLTYQPATGNVSELQRQPEQGRFTDTTEEIVAAVTGPVRFAVDPTRGQILELNISKPNLIERIQQGGLVGYIIISLGILGLLIAIERLFTLGIASRKVTAQLNSATPNDNNPLGRVLMVYDNNRGVDTETLELKMSEAVFKETPALGRALLFLKIIAVVAPLMGLLGTVTGMIKTFQAITLFGTGDPKLMAGGISQALVTTVLGLTVAIPTVLLHTLVSGRSRRIVHILQEQSAGMIAEHSERQGSA